MMIVSNKVAKSMFSNEINDESMDDFAGLINLQCIPFNNFLSLTLYFDIYAETKHILYFVYFHWHSVMKHI